MMVQAQAAVRVGVDIGGTFTDLVLVRADGRTAIAKLATTPDDPSAAVVAGISELLATEGVAPASVAEVVHGTTVGSNAILQKRGARTGLLTTRGFRDTLEIARIRTPGMFDLAWEKPEPLVPRRWRLEVEERMLADGTVLRPLDPDSVRAACRRFVAEGIEAVAICLINSYVNPAHEQAIKELLAREYPQFLVSASCDVLAEMKEYERTSTTVVNAYLLPTMRVYLDRLAEKLAAAGLAAPILVMASNGGTLSLKTASRKPVFVVASGPAGGVIGAARLGRPSGHADLIVFDMGGTTAKAAIIEGGRASITGEYEFRDGISAPSRFIRGGGYTLKVPAIDVAEVGAGGGSIARVDAGGLLHVGPESAGAVPGPACYGFGNREPTVTDANFLLGYLDPKGLLGGTLKIDRALAEAAILRAVAERLGIDAVHAAHGIRRLANASMARAIRAVTIERGRDPRELAMMAFGGNGPVHAAEVARELAISRIIVPARSGVFSAVGMLAADVEHPIVRPVLKLAASLASADFVELIAALEDEGARALAADGFERRQMSFELAADLRYQGQSSELSIGFATGAAPTALAEDFGATHHTVFGYRTAEPVELVALRCIARGLRAGRYEFTRVKPSAGTAKPRSRRPASFSADAGFIETPVFAWADLGTSPVAGPAIIEAYDTTVVVPPKSAIRADAFGSLVIELE